MSAEPDFNAHYRCFCGDMRPKTDIVFCDDVPVCNDNPQCKETFYEATRPLPRPVPGSVDDRTCDV